jgi:hypothetical protein
MSCDENTGIDPSNMTCFEYANALLAAYTSAITGGTAVQVRHGNNWVTYRTATASDMVQLRNLYQAVRASCPDAARLPDLSPSARVIRGPSARLRICR